MDDLLWTTDGRRIGRLDPVFKTGLNIKEAQIVQEDLGRILLRYVPAAGYSKTDEQAITHNLKLRMGEIDIRFEPVDRIPRGSNGKFKAVVGLADLQK
jgi:phenylacetate-CoA ligase